MKGKIDSHGCLQIDRAGTMTLQVCPFDHGEERETFWCRDVCPLFGEPEHLYGHDSKSKWRTLRLCKTKLKFSNFTDERSET